MGRNFESQGHLGLIMWDGRVDSFESHMIQDCSVIQDQIDLHLGLRWEPHTLEEYRWGDAVWVTSGLFKSSIRCSQTRLLLGSLGRHQAATERKQ